MATKTYKAIGTQVSLNLFIGGRNFRVMFHPVSNYVAGQGGSELTTDNPSLQKALESNGNFGRLYWLKADDGTLVKELPGSKNEAQAAAEPPLAEKGKETGGRGGCYSLNWGFERKPAKSPSSMA